MAARATARGALAPMSAVLADKEISAADTARATEEMRSVFTAMHLGVAAAAEKAGDPKLKATIAAYQMSVEQAIVILEGSDGDRTKLAAAIDFPELQSSESAVLTACA